MKMGPPGIDHGTIAGEPEVWTAAVQGRAAEGFFVMRHARTPNRFRGAMLAIVGMIMVSGVGAMFSYLLIEKQRRPPRRSAPRGWDRASATRGSARTTRWIVWLHATVSGRG